MQSVSSSPRYFPHINLLRAFAAISVVIYHLIEHYDWQGFPIEYGMIWFRIGWMSVDLFFVISGFVIGWSLIQLHHRSHSFHRLAKEFIWRRAGRIIPLYLLTMLVFAIAIQPTLFSPYHWLDWVTHLTFTHPFTFNTFGSINGVNWSVGIEVHFYLFALLTSPIWVKWSGWRLLATGILIAWMLRYLGWVVGQEYGLSHHEFFQLMVQMPMMLDEFAAGAGLALLIRRYPPENWPGMKWQQGMVLAGISASCLTVAFLLFWQDAIYWHNPLLVIFWRSLLALAFMAVLAFFIWLPHSTKSGVFYRTGHYLGDISYGIYLWHLPVILYVKPYIIGSPELYLLVTLPIIFLLSSASWHGLEKPAIGWSKRQSLAQ